MKPFPSRPFRGILKFPFYRHNAGTGLPCIVFCITVAHPDRRSQNLSIKLVNDPIVWEVGVEMRGPGNRGPMECGTTHEATTGMSS